MSAKPDVDLQGVMQQLLGGMNANKARVLPGWWNSVHYQQTMTFNHRDLINFAKSALFAMCLTQGGTVLDTTVAVKEVAVDSPAGSIEEFAKSAGFRCVYIRTGADTAEGFLVSKTAAIQLYVDVSIVDACIVADVVTISPAELAELREAIEKHYEQVEA
jgi:hypothetical protein